MEVVADSALVTSGATTEVTTEVTTTDVNVATPKIAEVSTNTYVLSTGGVYSGNIHNGVPTWLTDAIIAQVTAGTLNISQLVNDLYVLVQSIELGVNQSIASVQNEVVSQSQYLTTVKSELQGDIAVAIEQYDTIVSPELAKAVKTDALGVIKGQVEAWALDVTDVYASNNLASATQVELLTSTLTDVNTGTVATATKLYEGYTTIGITPDGTGIASAGYLDTLSASVDDVNTGIAATATKLSEGYTTIGITPDGTGIASAGYLDTLSASVDDVSVALTTVERVAVEANEWSASSSKLITGPDGSITGWGFSDGSNEVSNFQIKATNFSISDGLTGHTPFSIVGSDVNFNGKVTFSSISDSGTYIPTISSVAAAQTEAADAKENAIAALTQLTDIASDSVLDPGEKTSVIAARDVIVAEKAGIDTQATAYGITTEKTTYDNAVGALTTYLATLTSPVLWSNLSGNTTIVGTTFRSKFNNVYTTRQALLDKIAIIAKSLVDTAQSTANSKPNVYYQTTAPSSVGRVLGDLWFDSDDKNHPYRWSGAAWASIRDLSIADTATASASANTAALNAMTAAQAAQATADGATTTYYQSAAPTGLNSSTDIGDMWFDTDDNQAYRWSGTTWLTIQDKSIVVALAAAQDAQTTADGKITSFYQTAQPTGANIGDLWFDIDNKNEAHYYNGMAWTTLRDGTIADAFYAAELAQTEAADAKENAIAALTQLTDIASDSVLDPGEKTSVIAARDVIVAEKAGIDTQATAYGITTEKTTYDNAVGALTTYLATLTSPVLWSNLSGNTTIVGTTFRSKFNNVYTTRQALLDKIAIIAKSLVDTAQSTANSKPNVYYQTTAPSSVGRVLGDLWFDSDDKNHPYRWSGAAWASIRDLSIADTATASASANTAALNAMTAAQAAQATADGATTTYYQSAAPTGLNSSTDIGDMWFDTDDNQAYRWSGTTWLTIQDKSIVVALAAAQDAQTTADGKITSFYQTAQPTGANIGDLWFDIDNKNEAHYYNGMAWTTLRDGTIADAFYAAELAQTEAADAKENAIAALTQLTDIASDSVLDPGEKTLVRKEWEILVTEQVLIADQAAGLAVSAIDYRETLEYLGTYLNAGVAWLVSNPIVPTWLADVNLTTNTPINRSTFRGSFRMYYSERQLILNAISTKLKEIADSKVLPADVATAINTNITTIDGGKITTDAVFANRVFAENITATGTITGARINSGTITGARINGGTITSTDLVSSTIRVRDLQVVTDAGYPTVAIGTLFFTNTLTSYSEMVSYTNLYAYNATSVVSTYGTPIRAASSLIGTSISIYSPILLCIVTSNMGTKNAIYVAIYIGSTLLGTGRINGRGGEVAGITFSRTTSYSRNTGQYTDSMYVTSFTGAFTLSGEGPLKVVVTCRSATIQPANGTDNRALLSNL